MDGPFKRHEGRQAMEFQKNTNGRRAIDDHFIVDLYWARAKRAIEETDFKYKKYLLTVAYNILYDTLDSEECLNDTYLGAWNAMPPTKPNVLKAFLTVIMRRCAIKRYHTNKKRSAILSEMTVSLSELEDFISDGDVTDSDFDAEHF